MSGGKLTVTSIRIGDQDLNAAGNSNLRVALDGGVMLSGANTFQIVESVEVDDVRGSMTGSWSSLPASLWTTYTGEVVGDRDVWGMQVELDADFNRGTLDAASASGNQADLTGPSSVGYISLTNVNTGNLLQLRLGMDAASVGPSNLDHSRPVGRLWSKSVMLRMSGATAGGIGGIPPATSPPVAGRSTACARWSGNPPASGCSSPAARSFPGNAAHGGSGIGSPR